MNNDYYTLFDTLVRDNQDRIFSYCVVRLGEVHGEEVAQEVFVAAWQGLPNFRHEATLETWLLGIAKYKCIQALRNYRRREEILRLSEQEIRTYMHPDPPDPLDVRVQAMDTQVRRNRLAQSLSKLKDEERLVVNLRYMKGIAVSEIAELLDRSEAAVRKRLLRALQRLRKALHDDSQ